jgi:hypothetical protein
MQLFIVMLYVIMLSDTMLSFSLSVIMELHNEKCCYAAFRHAECRYSECHYAECRYAECRCSECDSGSVIMRSDVMLLYTIQNVNNGSVLEYNCDSDSECHCFSIILSASMLSVVILSVLAQ